MILPHLPIYNYVWTILLYIQACGLYYCYCSAKVPTRYGWVYRDERPKVYWVIIGIFGFCMGCFATGVILVNSFAYGRQITSVVAGLAVLAADYAVYVLPLGKMRDLARGLAVTVSLGLIAAFLLAAARNFVP